MTQADDELALKYGMQPKHAMRLREFCQGKFKNKKLLIVVRYTNPAALQWHGKEGYEPKPVTCKSGKSNAKGVVVDSETDLEIVSDTGKKYFSDYDLQGVYELRDTSPPTYYRFFSGNWVSLHEERDHDKIAKLNEREPIMNITRTVEIGTVGLAQFVLAINGHVCRDKNEPRMFQHGAQDGFLIAGRPVLNADEHGYLVFEPDGSMRALVDRGALQAYYLQHKISWAYKS